VDRKDKWEETQLEYDAGDFVYSKYTSCVIRTSHRQVVSACERVSHQLGRPLVILDIGCGSTDFYSRLNGVIDQYVGIEPSATELLRSPERPNQYLMRSMGERLCVNDGSADVVLQIGILDHCLDADKAISEAFRVLRPGGSLIIVLENRGRFSNDLRKVTNMEISHGDEHLYYFDVDDISSRVRGFGKETFGSSHGYLLGFNMVSKLLPESVVSALNRASDLMLSSVFPKKGQHFITVIEKAGDLPPKPIGFLCPKCSTTFAWEADRCEACGHAFERLRKDVIVALQL
jgi:ubiquinone/menaquinone biosynthesis C-methylase UbiE